ncbi:MAG: L-ribulose-5-phosphate 4-epimerase [Bacteroidales bacterium]|nr:L-ribulose-5-phosphate 4-epimerase [Bacteroidales bacterium]
MEVLKLKVFKANLDIVEHGLVKFTWGNVSGIDREQGLVVIKPSGISYEALRPEDLVVVDMEGKVVEGDLKPSSDTPTHLVLYNHFKNIGGIVHTHSEWATSWAQSRRPIPAYGTTHADYFYGEVPCTRPLTEAEVEEDYEANTGKVIVETFSGKDPGSVPGVVVNQHGPFAWGDDPDNAVHNAVILEEIAKMAFRNELLGNKKSMDSFLLDKHFLRKHGKDAYYGQDEKD